MFTIGYIEKIFFNIRDRKDKKMREKQKPESISYRENKKKL